MRANAGLGNPGGMAFDAAGNLYIADSTAHRIRKVDPAGVITTLAGNGNLGFSGDGGPAASAQFYGSFRVENERQVPTCRQWAAARRQKRPGVARSAVRPLTPKSLACNI